MKLEVTVVILNHKRLQGLETWLKATNTKLTQVNGQRKYGGPPDVWDGPTPAAHSEVFISQIPREVYEDVLIPLFSSVGPLWEFRLMMNFSGQNRGFAYAKYSSSEVAAHAIHLLHGHMVEPGFFLSVQCSMEKRHLCIGNLPAATRKENLLQVMCALVDGVKKVSLKPGPGIDEVSAIVAFTSHYTASMAKKILVEVFKRQFALTLSVKWQSSESSSNYEPLPPHKTAKSLASPWKMLPRLLLNAPRTSVSPPCLAQAPSTPPGFCRAVGETAAPPCSPSLEQLVAASPTMLLQRLCEATRLGQPLYEMYYSHVGRDRFLYFTYTVRVPGITVPFRGLVMVLPGHTATSTLEKAQQAVALQVLQRVQCNQSTPTLMSVVKSII
uniref:RRM domain-containing protein n=1 Tax=Echeneis naucrates TaxID=173247 RepID=A0A665UY64_ECHNA